MSETKIKDLQVGDTVKLIDGSGLVLVDSEKDTSNRTHECYIVNAYPEKTGSSLPLKGIECEVLKVGEEGFFAKGALNTIYKLDILIKCGEALLRTSSQFVRVIDNCKNDNYWRDFMKDCVEEIKSSEGRQSGPSPYDYLYEDEEEDNLTEQLITAINDLIVAIDNLKEEK